MAKSFMQFAQEAMAEVEGIDAEAAHQQLQDDPESLLIDVRDAAEMSHIWKAEWMPGVKLTFRLTRSSHRNIENYFVATTDRFWPKADIGLN